MFSTSLSCGACSFNRLKSSEFRFDMFIGSSVKIDLIMCVDRMVVKCSVFAFDWLKDLEL